MRSPGRIRVLCVDDEPDIQMIVRLSLEEDGFIVDACNSGTRALESVSRFNPDIIILDVMMPGLDGPATLAALRRKPEFGSKPVIFMTASGQAHEIAEYKSLGATDVIVKPFDPMTLAERVRANVRSS